MKKIIITLIILFLIYSIIVNSCAVVTEWDRDVIISMQNYLKNIPLWIPSLMDSDLYASLITIPIVVGGVYFFRKYLLVDILLFFSSPAISYIINYVLKRAVQRPRPPLELQIAIQLDSYSFVSSHTLISCTLWGLVVFYLLKYCQNKFLKISGLIFSFLWMGFIGFSRVWLGVHNPTDVIGAYFLALILVLIYISLIKLIGGKC